MSSIPEEGDVVVRPDRDLGWGMRGLNVYTVVSVSPRGTRVTLRRRRDLREICLTKRAEIRALRPFVQDDQAHIDADTRWLTALHQAHALKDWLMGWSSKRRDDEAVALFLEASKPLLAMSRQEKTG